MHMSHLSGLYVEKQVIDLIKLVQLVLDLKIVLQRFNAKSLF